MIQDALPQQVKLRAPIHLALERLEPIDVALRFIIAPLLGEAGLNRCQIELQSSREAAQVGDRAARRRCRPLLQVSSLPFPRHRGALASEGVRLGNCRIRPADLVEQRGAGWCQ